MKLISSVLAGVALAAGGTDYSTQGENWEGTCADGQRQSPINIQSQTANREFNYDWFLPENYGTDYEWKIDLGGSIKFSPPADGPKMTGGNLNNGGYNLLQFHLHWGSVNENNTPTGGSEHTMDGYRYFSEIHLVHWKDEYGDVGTALNEPDGLAVLGYFIDISDEDTALDEALNWAMDNIDSESDENPKWNGTMGDLVDNGDNFQNFYRYQGSLTTPTCNEAVQWTVFEKPLTIKPMTAERMTAAPEFNNNWRVVMPMNGRDLTFYHNEEESSSAVTTCAATSLLTVLAANFH